MGSFDDYTRALPVEHSPTPTPTRTRTVAGDGFTILEKAIVEHNMVAASKVYDNIRFPELGPSVPSSRVLILLRVCTRLLTCTDLSCLPDVLFLIPFSFFEPSVPCVVLNMGAASPDC